MSGPYNCDYGGPEFFYPLADKAKVPGDEGSPQIDIFVYIYLVYKFMTGTWPGDVDGQSAQEIVARISQKNWPPQEKEHIGEILHKRWDGAFQDAEQVKAAVVTFLEGLE